MYKDMSHNNEERVFDEADELKQQIEGKEILFMTEILEARRQVAEKIEKARKKADQDYQDELNNLQEERKKILADVQDHFKELLNETEKAEDEVIFRIKEKYEQREKEVVQNLIKLILP